MTRLCLLTVFVLSMVGSAIGRDAVFASGPWEMEQASAPGMWMPAVVPGTVLTTLVKNGVVPDPYYGLNNKLENKLIPDLSENREFYTATFRTKAGTYDAWFVDVENRKKVSPYEFGDEVRVRFGVREAYSDQSGPGGARQFYVNRRKVFIRGTNWIPEAMLKADDARMERELRLTAESGVNMVRLWAGANGRPSSRR